MSGGNGTQTAMRTMLKPPTRRHEDRTTEVQLLSNELGRIASENQNSWTVFASLLGVALVAGGGFIALDDKKNAPPWIWAVLALLPVLVLAYVVAMFSQQVMRSYYARGIERRIIDLSGDSAVGGGPAIQVLESFNAVITGNRRGFGELRFINWLEYGLVTLVALGSSGYALAHVHPRSFQVANGGVILIATLATGLAARRAIVHGSDAYNDAVARLATELAEEFPKRSPRRDRRRLISYLLLPRRNEFLVKAVMLHLTSAILGVWLAHDSVRWSSGVRSACISFVAFEFLLYQGRYMWNDYLGVVDDENSPYRDARGRLPLLNIDEVAVPGGTRIRRSAFFVVMGLRMLAALVLPVLVLPQRLAVALFCAMAACLVAAAIYERLRRQGRPAPGFRTTPRYLAIYGVVGTSYSIRVVIGMYLGSHGSASVGLLVASGIAFYSVGVATVLMGWVLEAANYIMIYRQAGQDQVAIAASIGSKGHLLPLARLAGKLDPATPLETFDALDITDPQLSVYAPYKNQAILRGGDSFQAPWNVLLIIAAGAAGVAGSVGSSIGTRYIGLVSILSAGSGFVATKLPRLMAGFAAVIVVFNIAGAIVIGRATMAFLSIPLLAVIGTYSSVRFMTYEETIGFFKVLRDLPSRIWTSALIALRALWA